MELTLIFSFGDVPIQDQLVFGDREKSFKGDSGYHTLQM